MTQRTCPHCGDPMPPRRRVQCGKPECKAAYHRDRNRVYLTKRRRSNGIDPQPFDCANCGKRCVPGEDVVPHATKFCSRTCKSAWSYRQTVDLAERLTRDPNLPECAQYTKAMRLDPCAYCGEPSQALDHIVPKSDDGPNDWTNRTGACHSCNSSKQQSPLLIYLGWRRAREQFEPWRAIVAEIHTRAA